MIFDKKATLESKIFFCCICQTSSFSCLEIFVNSKCCYRDIQELAMFQEYSNFENPFTPG